MSLKVETCKVCGANVPVDDGWLIPHKVLDSPTEICESRQPAKGEYPVGFDSDPWVMNGGLPTLGHHR